MRWAGPPYLTHPAEDLIAWRLLKQLGPRSQCAVEFGAHDGWYKSNTAFFRDMLGWTVVHFDNCPRSDSVYAEAITAENVNEVFRKYLIPRDVDLVSIDVDGNDLWIWKALEYEPLVVIIEYNPRWRPPRRRTIPYDPDRTEWDHTEYYGASAGALVALGSEKGYSLAAATKWNLIFAPAGRVPEFPVEKVEWRKYHKRPDSGHRPWVSYP